MSRWCIHQHRTAFNEHSAELNSQIGTAQPQFKNSNIQFSTLRLLANGACQCPGPERRPPSPHPSRPLLLSLPASVVTTLADAVILSSPGPRLRATVACLTVEHDLGPTQEQYDEVRSECNALQHKWQAAEQTASQLQQEAVERLQQHNALVQVRPRATSIAPALCWRGSQRVCGLGSAAMCRDSATSPPARECHGLCTFGGM